MFANAMKFNGNITDWNTSLVKDMSYMFTNAYAFNQDISRWSTSQVEVMQDIFDGASSFDRSKYVKDWDITGVFDNSELLSLYVSAHNFKNVEW